MMLRNPCVILKSHLQAVLVAIEAFPVLCFRVPPPKPFHECASRNFHDLCSRVSSAEAVLAATTTSPVLAPYCVVNKSALTAGCAGRPWKLPRRALLRCK